jgi:hypothetical protein
MGEAVEGGFDFKADVSVEEITVASNMFDDLCLKRHEGGAEEYGPFAFLKNDMIKMMIEEMCDVANYARYEFIKLVILDKKLSETLEQNEDFRRHSEEPLQ